MPENWNTRLLNWPGAGVQAHDPAIAGYRDLVALAAAVVENGSDVVAQSMGGVVAIGLALGQAPEDQTPRIGRDLWWPRRDRTRR
jgi:hypothetical protein